MPEFDRNPNLETADGAPVLARASEDGTTKTFDHSRPGPVVVYADDPDKKPGIPVDMASIPAGLYRRLVPKGQVADPAGVFQKLAQAAASQPSAEPPAVKPAAPEPPPVAAGSQKQSRSRKKPAAFQPDASVQQMIREAVQEAVDQTRRVFEPVMPSPSPSPGQL